MQTIFVSADDVIEFKANELSLQLYTEEGCLLLLDQHDLIDCLSDVKITDFFSELVRVELRQRDHVVHTKIK